MSKRAAALVLAFLVFAFSRTSAQQTPWYQWTFLPPAVMDEIIGEASGETAWNTIAAATPFERDRLSAEYRGTFWEAQYVLDQLKLYRIPGAEIVRFPGGQTWDGVKGELWEVSPRRQKLASYQDLRAMLASGSTDADVTAPLVWVGMGTQAELERAGVAGKIVVTEGAIAAVHRLACQQMGALGVVSIANGRPLFDPLQIPNTGISGRGTGAGAARFGFFIPPREAEILKQRLLNGEAITVRAQVKAATESYEIQDLVAHIPGTDPNAGEVILSAHLFEGYVKQGANDNLSGSAAILEVARTLHTLIEEGRIPRPKRTIRFLWGPEFSGTGPWVAAHKDLMERTLANINMDMVGEWLVKNKSYMTLVRTTYGNPHYINDVMENYYRFVGEGNREQLANRSGFYKITHRIVAPTGSDEPFYYSVDTHYGASDHMVFNDWGVQVPGIMMIAWPDQWYHTSGDRPDKADPTQLKRVAVIGAAGAYTLAVADDEMALKIAGETASNATRRLGHQFVMGLEKLNNANANAGDLEASYRWARALVEGAAIAEKATLETINELAADKARVGAFVKAMQAAVDQVAAAHLAALEARMGTVAAKLNARPVRLAQTELERRAARTIPRPTPLVKANGYQGWRAPLQAVPADVVKRYPTEGVASIAELQLLVNGRNSVLDIKKMLDAQFRTTSDLQAIFNHLEVLKAAGLVEM